MPRFIHLNGPPGIGKSTVARAFAAEHPGVLNLDIDQVVALIGGWQDCFWDALKAGGMLAASMARTHLASGRDVIMPRLIANSPDFAKFETAAATAGAEYCHILLTADVESAIARFAQRAAADESSHHGVIRKSSTSRAEVTSSGRSIVSSQSSLPSGNCIRSSTASGRHPSRPTAPSRLPSADSPRGAPK